MADTTTKLDPETHLLLDQPLLRLPHELLKKNLKSAQKHIEMAKAPITDSSTPAKTASSAEQLAALDTALAKAQNLKRKLEALQTEEKALHRQQKARIRHLQNLHEVQTLVDVKYEDWSQVRLDRLLVDYLLRQGYTQSARELAQERGIGELVDVGVFQECGRIERSLREGRVQECLAWCAENKQGLKKINSNLDLELRLQQTIELARTGQTTQLLEALLHARKHLSSTSSSSEGNTAATEFALLAGGLLAYPPDSGVPRYQDLYSPTRYQHLATTFLRTHHELFALPSQPLLHIALSAGLSALKTPSCHSVHALQERFTSTGSPVCPICSTELNELARGVPYAHHTKSSLEEDPVVLPNGRVFGRQRLERLNEKMGKVKGGVMDPLDGAKFAESDVRKVFIS